MSPNIEAMLLEHDAALMIGDAAMRASRRGLLVLDLAGEWHAWTGLPFVFAIWAVKADAPEMDLSVFRRSYELGRQNLDNIIDEAMPTIGWTVQELRDYLTVNLSHTLGEAEMEGLSLFYEKCVSMGFAAQNQPLRFL
jgi:chorismate dehydratase